MHLITGKSGSEHITSANDGFKHSQIFGSGSYVFRGYGEFVASKYGTNAINISKGQGIINGRMFESTETETVSIANGTSGYKRIDLIVARYTKDVATGIESIAFAVVQGGRTTGTPMPPSHVTDSILEGATIAEMPLYEVLIDGLDISTITKVYEYKEMISDRLEITKNIVNDGSYNLIPFPYAENSKALNGITFDVNDDGSVHVSGTASANTTMNLNIKLPLETGKKYAVVNEGYTDEPQGFLQIYPSDWSDYHTTFRHNPFTTINKSYLARIYIAQGKTIDATFKPMVVEVGENESYPQKYMRGSIKNNSQLTDAINSMLASGEPFLTNGKWVYEETSGSTDGSGWYNLPTDYNKYTFIIACPLISGFQCKITKSSARWVVRCVDAITTTLGGTSYSVDVGCKSKAVKIGLLMFEPAVSAQNFDEE